jgi:hypothetical protein
MPASKRRSKDPFRPPGAEEPTPELAELPRRAAPSNDLAPPAMPEPERRRPLKYRKPSTSWVTFVVLGFAAVGMAAIGGTALKKLMGRDIPSPAEQSAKIISYAALSKDDAVLVTVQLSPRDARVMLDGEPTVSNPLRILRSKTPHKIAVSAPGYAGVMQEIVPDASKTVRFNLKKQR